MNNDAGYEPFQEDVRPVGPAGPPSFVPILPPPTASNLGPQYLDRPENRTRKILIASIIVLSVILLITTTSVVYAMFSETSHPTNAPLQQVALQSTSTEQPTQPPVTPTPTSTPVQHQLSSQQTLSHTANATGSQTTPATHATGTLKYCGPSPLTTTVNQGTTFYNKEHTVQVVVDAAISSKAGVCGTGPAHAVQTGSIGNIPAGDMLQIQGGTGSITNDQPFAGGKNAQTSTVVQQSDIDHAATSLEASTTQSAETNIQQQLQANERLVGSPQCTSNVTHDHNVGDKVSQVTVTVTTTCTATVSG